MASAPPMPNAAVLPDPAASVQLGLVVAVILHLALLALLSINWPESEKPVENPPMEVDLIAEVAPKSTAPEISQSPPAAKLGEVEEDTPPAPAPPPKIVPPSPPRAVPAKVTPVKAPPIKAPMAKAPPAKQPPTQSPSAKAPPAKAPPATRPPTGRLDGITDGLTKTPTKGPTAKAPPAAQTAAEVRKSIDVSIKGAVVPRWNSCRISGVDIGLLSTTVKFRLSQSGALEGFTGVTTSGENDSNRFQVQRHQECAKRAVELAAPFDLPTENYDFWRNYTLDFVKR